LQDVVDDEENWAPSKLDYYQVFLRVKVKVHREMTGSCEEPNKEELYFQSLE